VNNYFQSFVDLDCMAQKPVPISIIKISNFIIRDLNYNSM